MAMMGSDYISFIGYNSHVLQDKILDDSLINTAMPFFGPLFTEERFLENRMMQDLFITKETGLREEFHKLTNGKDIKGNYYLEYLLLWIHMSLNEHPRSLERQLCSLDWFSKQERSL